MTQEIARETGFEITTHRLDFFGIFPECRKNPEPQEALHPKRR